MKPIAGEQRFQGFSGETFRFLRGLAEHPSKAYWDSHREIYRREVLIPMRHLLAALEAEFGPGKLLSMRRDNRFSPNPAPYKSYLGAVVYRESGMCYYVEISHEGLMAAGGWRFNHPADQVGRFRAAIDREASGQAFERIAARLRGNRFELVGDKIKTAPKGYPADHPRAEWLRYKTVCAEYRWPVEDWMFTEEVLQRVESAWRETQPLIDWLERHVGPSTLTCRCPAAASTFGGLSSGIGVLIDARAMQGLGVAITAPAVLSLAMIFPKRNGIPPRKLGLHSVWPCWLRWQMSMRMAHSMTQASQHPFLRNGSLDFGTGQPANLVDAKTP